MKARDSLVSLLLFLLWLFVCLGGVLLIAKIGEMLR